jgi:hypothetical protein
VHVHMTNVSAWSGLGRYDLVAEVSDCYW